MEACPKCNFALTPEALECPACGVILAKLRAGLQRQLRSVPPPLPEPEPAPLPAQSPPVPAANPYAPPTVPTEAPRPLPAAMPAPAAAPAQDVITRSTLETFDALRPWLRFMAVYAMIASGLCIVGGLAIGLSVRGNALLFLVAFAYMAYGGIGFFILQPLKRSADALEHIPFMGASRGVEVFFKEMTSFWRRIGWFCIGSILLLVIGFMAGAFSSVTSQRGTTTWSTSGSSSWP